jgi:lysophospholipase L1-like esterase
MRLKLRKRALLAVAIPVAAIAAAVGLLGGNVSNAGPGHPYLALGDSVAFGYITQAGFAYGNPENFVGYPDYVAPDLGMTPVNASCPGEATGGFISLGSPIDNGCRAFRSFAPLHVSYSTSQLDFAKAYLKSHKNTKLVTIQLGANDAFLLQKQCQGNPTCIQAGFPALIGTISANMDMILQALGGKHFHGVLMIVNYYSQDYGDMAGTGLVVALNQAVAAHAKADGAVVADAFTAFKNAAFTGSAAGNSCKAGLLNVAPQAPGASFDPNKCDVHPSQSGQKLLAQAVEDAYKGPHHH